jgi:hypothetical protein
VEPLKPDVKKAILDANPQAQPADIEEYEQLLAERYLLDPDMPSEDANAPMGAPAGGSSGTSATAAPDRSTPEGSAQVEDRLAVLHARLFPAAAHGQRNMPSLPAAPANDLTRHER